MSSNTQDSIHGFTTLIEEQNRVPGFDPLRLVQVTPQGPKLALPYKRIWFRKKYPNGRIRQIALKITDQLAIIEAQVFSDRRESEPIARYIAQVQSNHAPHGQYIQAAQDLAVDQALADAGFDIQFMPDASSQKEKDAKQAASPAQPKEVKRIPAAEPARVIHTMKAVGQKKAPVQKQPVPPTSAAEETISPLAELAKQAETVSAPKQESIQLEDFEDIIPLEEETSESTPPVPAYTPDMPVEQICSLMSLEEAQRYVVQDGTCRGWTLEQVAQRRPASLKFYVNGYSGKDNVLRAGAKLMMDSAMKQAG